MTNSKIRIFGMVSTEASRDYTPIAINSFLRYTELSAWDRFFLIDNDGSYAHQEVPAKIERLTNMLPRSYAANANHILQLAASHRAKQQSILGATCTADVFLLNNDLAFTEGWIEPLLEHEKALVSPISNREKQYSMYGLTLDRTLASDDLLGKESALELIAKHHKEHNAGVLPVLWLPFFCIKIPLQVYSLLGPLDETFGRGGGEDNDYCVRAILAGIPILYANQSYILHFNGKSTWDGAESPDATELRCKLFRQHFGRKWGEEMVALLIDHDLSVVEGSPILSRLLHEGRARELIMQLLARRNT